MKRLFLIICAVAASASLAGCPATFQGQPVDYQTLAQNACGLATSEIAALQSVRADMSDADKTLLDKIASPVVETCSAVSLATASPQVTWQSITAALTQITVLIATYHPASGVPT